MSDQLTTVIVDGSIDEDECTGSDAQDMLAAEPCSEQCPTCQKPCEYTAGHGGLHHCENGHEWI
jgi:hypothetical protein